MPVGWKRLLCGFPEPYYLTDFADLSQQQFSSPRLTMHEWQPASKETARSHGTLHVSLLA